jgi:hypothetical protein
LDEAMVDEMDELRVDRSVGALAALLVSSLAALMADQMVSEKEKLMAVL